MSNTQWTASGAVPGRIKPVYGAKYPPPITPYPTLLSSNGTNNNDKSSGSVVVESGLEKDADARAFAQFHANTLDAWSADSDSELIAKTATQVIARHHQRAASTTEAPAVDPIMSMPSTSSPGHVQFIREQALQRLATQRANEQVMATAATTTPKTSNAIPSLYPRLPETSALNMPSSSTTQGASGKNKKVIAAYRQRQVDPATPMTPSVHDNRVERIDALLKEEMLDLAELRKLCWKGIPARARPTVWRLLSTYLPANASRRALTLSNKREEYFRYVEQYFHTRHDEQHEKTFRQIHIDIPRMCPLIPLFQQKIVQEIFERILYIWAIRHPASGYVQGINDLVTPFFVVFLSELIDDSNQSVSTYDVSALPSARVQEVEADSFWCVSALLDAIQDNYTFSMPGIQKKVHTLSMLMSKIDAKLHAHLLTHQVEYLQFAFRWMNNLLMRELPLRATIRLWDTYMSEASGFSDFHVYVCAAFLRMWSRQLQERHDFQSIMVYLQNLPTSQWSD